VYLAQYYLECLSLASYLVADDSTGHAVVVDPRRDVTDLLQDVHDHGFTVIGVINTHFHADFLAGHLELADATGAWIGYGRRAEAEYPIRRFVHGERIALGDVTLQILETPGHTPESISVLVHESPRVENPYGVLTGDSLFIGDVGRPDLLSPIGVGAHDLARELYRSIQHTLMSLPDTTRVFPGHGAGSACGKNLSTQRQSTIGDQRRTNYACHPMSEQEFVDLVLDGQPTAPRYFLHDAILNRRYRDLFDRERGIPELAPEQLHDLPSGEITVVDTRDPQLFAAGHLTGSVNIPLTGRFAETAGTVLPPDRDLVLVATEDSRDEAVTRLARIGYDRIRGYLPPVERTWRELTDRTGPTGRLTVAGLARIMAGNADPVLLDVRNSAETKASGAIAGSTAIPLAELGHRLVELPVDRPIVVYCASGYRSSVAASVIRAHGHPDVSDLIGGFEAWQHHEGSLTSGSPRSHAEMVRTDSFLGGDDTSVPWTPRPAVPFRRADRI
jgi:glyoxylase-like metal-dependent hydrolase (beta-lactamase superfamily II)